MEKILAVLKKDIKLQMINWKEILFTIVGAIAIILVLNFSNSNKFTVGVEGSIKDQMDFNVVDDGIKVNFMGGDVHVKMEIDDREILEDRLKNNVYPVIAYEDNGEVALKMNTKDPLGLPTYALLSRHLNGVTKDNFRTDYMASGSNTTLMLVISMVLLFGGASKGSSVLFQEKNDGTLNILYKSGLSSFGIVLAKMIFTILVMMVIFLGVGIVAHFMGSIELVTGVKDIFCLVFILIPIAILGNFMGIISKTIEENRTYQLLIFFPAMFYTSIASKIPEGYLWIVRLHPGIAVMDFYEKAIEGHFDIFLFSAIAAISCIMFAVNVMVMRRAAEKSL